MSVDVGLKIIFLSICYIYAVKLIKKEYLTEICYSLVKFQEYRLQMLATVADILLNSNLLGLLINDSARTIW